MSEEVLIVQVYKPHTSVKGFGLRFVDVVLYTGAAYLDSLSKTVFCSFHRSMNTADRSRGFSRYRAIDMDMKMDLVKILEGKQ